VFTCGSRFAFATSFHQTVLSCAKRPSASSWAAIAPGVGVSGGFRGPVSIRSISKVAGISRSQS